ncbi:MULTISPECIES: tetratricopeptide repeat protein [unclassified Flavobacterium]|uniref:tetratricopeptide repeat protein n=1 Tax=unclassified Flavobacterium TaxID=196869 RepID=UPI00360DA7AE
MKNVFLSLLLAVSFSNYGQDYFEQFKTSWKNDHDFTKTEKIIKEWESKTTNDPNLYIAAFNFYFTESRKEILALDTHPGEGENFELKDSLNKTAGYIKSTNLRNDGLFDLSQNYLTTGIQKFPTRLDLRFGKIFALGDFKRLDDFTKDILTTLDYSASINHKWLWKEDKPLEGEIIFIKSAVQDYQNTLYQNNSYVNMRKIAEKMNTLFPKDPIILSTLGTSYLLEEKHEKALTIFKEGNSLDPNDEIIINNIAFCYFHLNDKANAKKYYEQLTKAKNTDISEFAKEKLKELK